jgi:hypothetical protein
VKAFKPPQILAVARSRLRSATDRNASVFLLLLALGVQVTYLGGHDGLRLARQSWQSRKDPARVRSARLAFGASFSEYIEFLEGTVPQDALVVIPPVEHDPVFGNMGLMQYLLFPRQLTNCPSIDLWEECKGNYLGGKTYLIAVGGFPSREQAPDSTTYIPFDASRGIFVPAEVSSE